MTRNHQNLVIAKQSTCWANRSCDAVQRGIRHTNTCMTSMRWLLRRPDHGLRNFKQIYHESMKFTHNWLQICTIKLIISKIHSYSIVPSIFQRTWNTFLTCRIFAACPACSYTRSRPEDLQRITSLINKSGANWQLGIGMYQISSRIRYPAEYWLSGSYPVSGG